MPYRPPPIGTKVLVVTSAARADIDNVLNHIAKEAGDEVALGFADTIDRELSRLAYVGHSGASREWISPGLRLHVIGNYCVYFRVVANETRIVRVVHGHMDVNAIVFDPNA